MIINDLYLDSFRNYDKETARFGDSVNVITGRNAQGKTNLIEAVYYLATGRSFRQTGDKELISFDKESACIRANVISGGREQTLEARIVRGRRREFFANGVKLTNASELAGRLTAVQFGPDDLEMIKEGAAVRRKLMDQCLSQLRPGYLATLTEYNRLYEHKTRILRDYREKPSLLELLDDFNLRLAQHSARLIYYRTAFSSALSRRAAEIHSIFSGGAERLAIRYKTVGGMDASGKKPEQILPELLEHQKEHRQAELKSGLCLSGAHKDDLEIDINDVPARKFGSQGQM
jgi:DNA replication and repair protein RecF